MWPVRRSANKLSAQPLGFFVVRATETPRANAKPVRNLDLGGLELKEIARGRQHPRFQCPFDVRLPLRFPETKPVSFFFLGVFLLFFRLAEQVLLKPAKRKAAYSGGSGGSGSDGGCGSLGLTGTGDGVGVGVGSWNWIVCFMAYFPVCRCGCAGI